VEGSLRIENSIIEKNYAFTSIGLVADGGDSWISNTTFYDNLAPVTFEEGNHKISNCNFVGSSVLVDDLGVLTISHSNFSKNELNPPISIGSPGTGTVIVSNSRFFDNNLSFANSNQGGAIYSEGRVVIHECEFRNNVASRGGALYIAGQLASLNCSKSYFLANTATDFAGSVYVAANLSLIASSTFKKSLPVGSGIYVDVTQGTLLLEECFILNDTVAAGRRLPYDSSSSYGDWLDTDYTTRGIELRSTTIQSDLPSIYLVNAYAVLNSVNFFPLDGPSSLQPPPQTVIGDCSNSTIQFNSYYYPITEEPWYFAFDCNTVFSPQLLSNESVVPIVFYNPEIMIDNALDNTNGSNLTINNDTLNSSIDHITQVISFYFSWENSGSSSAVTFMLDSSSVILKRASVTLVMSLASENSYPTIHNSTWTSSLPSSTDGRTLSKTNLTLNELDGSLQIDGIYVIGVIASYSLVPSVASSSSAHSVIKTSLSVISRSSTLDLNRTIAQVVPRFAFTGAPFVVNISVFDNWGHPLPTLEERYSVRYDNTSYPLNPSSLSSFNTPSNIGWHPWAVQDIYLDITPVATITGKHIICINSFTPP